MVETKAGSSVRFEVPSFTTRLLSVVSVDAGSSIVPVAAEGVPSVAFIGFDSVRVKVSAPSAASSAVVSTSIVPVAVLSAARIISVPLADVTRLMPETLITKSVSVVAFTASLNSTSISMVSPAP